MRRTLLALLLAALTTVALPPAAAHADEPVPDLLRAVPGPPHCC